MGPSTGPSASGGVSGAERSELSLCEKTRREPSASHQARKASLKRLPAVGPHLHDTMGKAKPRSWSEDQGWRVGKRNEQSTEDPLGSENPPYDALRADTGPPVLVQTHRTYGTKRNCVQTTESG